MRSHGRAVIALIESVLCESAQTPLITKILKVHPPTTDHLHDLTQVFDKVPESPDEIADKLKLVDTARRVMAKVSSRAKSMWNPDTRLELVKHAVAGDRAGFKSELSRLVGEHVVDHPDINGHLPGFMDSIGKAENGGWGFDSEDRRAHDIVRALRMSDKLSRTDPRVHKVVGHLLNHPFGTDLSPEHAAGLHSMASRLGATHDNAKSIERALAPHLGADRHLSALAVAIGTHPAVKNMTDDAGIFLAAHSQLSHTDNSVQLHHNGVVTAGLNQIADAARRVVEWHALAKRGVARGHLTDPESRSFASTDPVTQPIKSLDHLRGYREDLEDDDDTAPTAHAPGSLSERLALYSRTQPLRYQPHEMGQEPIAENTTHRVYKIADHKQGSLRCWRPNGTDARYCLTAPGHDFLKEHYKGSYPWYVVTKKGNDGERLHGAYIPSLLHSHPTEAVRNAANNNPIVGKDFDAIHPLLSKADHVIDASAHRYREGGSMHAKAVSNCSRVMSSRAATRL